MYGNQIKIIFKSIQNYYHQPATPPSSNYTFMYKLFFYKFKYLSLNNKIHHISKINIKSRGECQAKAYKWHGVYDYENKAMLALF